MVWFIWEWIPQTQSYIKATDPSGLEELMWVCATLFQQRQQITLKNVISNTTAFALSKPRMLCFPFSTTQSLCFHGFPSLVLWVWGGGEVRNWWGEEGHMENNWALVGEILLPPYLEPSRLPAHVGGTAAWAHCLILVTTNPIIIKCLWDDRFHWSVFPRCYSMYNPELLTLIRASGDDHQSL